MFGEADEELQAFVREKHGDCIISWMLLNDNLMLKVGRGTKRAVMNDCCSSIRQASVEERYAYIAPALSMLDFGGAQK